MAKLFCPVLLVHALCTITDTKPDISSPSSLQNTPSASLQFSFFNTLIVFVGLPSLYGVDFSFPVQVNKPFKAQVTATSAQVTSDEGFVEQNSDEEQPPPVPPHPLPLPDISLETCMSASQEKMYNDIPIKSHPPPPDPPHHAHTGSNLSHDSHSRSILVASPLSEGTSPPSLGTSGDLVGSGAASLAQSQDTGIASRAYSLSQPRAYSPRESAQFAGLQGELAADEGSPSARYARSESLLQQRAYSPRQSRARGQEPVEGGQNRKSVKEQLAAQTMELDRMQSSLLQALETMRVESPPGVSKPTITVVPGQKRPLPPGAVDVDNIVSSCGVVSTLNCSHHR